MGIIIRHITPKILLHFAFCSLCLTMASAQEDSTWVNDDLASSYVQAGKRLLASGEYPLALEAFDSALLRPFHPQTTTATYLKGLSYFYMGEEEMAIDQLEGFLQEYPQSRYQPEALYHLSILYLEGWPDDREIGLRGLMGLSEQDSLPSLAISASEKIKEYFFTSCDTALLVPLLDMAEEEEIPAYLEPYCFCLKERLNQPKLAEMVYEEYMFQYDQRNNFLERLFDSRKENRFGDRENIKIAVFLPLFLEEGRMDSTRSVPRKSKIALEFWEGLQMAYEGLEPDLKKRVTLRVFDTKRDSTTVENHLEELDAWYPDLVIGAVYNNQTEIISRWSERTGTPQIVPFSPSGKLVEGKQFTFLAHPDISVHGREIAEYATDSLGLRKIAVFTNETSATERLADPFIDEFRTRGGEIFRITVDSVFDEEEAKDLVSLTRSVKLQGCDGVFIPIFGDQETAGLIMSQLSVMELSLPVLASPHAWKRYTNIDRDLKERFELTFSTSFMCNQADTTYKTYLRETLEQFHVPPSDFHTQGYDLGMWMLTVVNEYPFMYLSLADFLRDYPTYQGLHQDIGFEGKQCNQTVNLGRFRDGRVEKLNSRLGWLSEEQPDDE